MVVSFSSRPRARKSLTSLSTLIASCMRPALQRLLRSPSALGVLRNAIESPLDWCFCPQALCGRRAYSHGTGAIPTDGAFSEAPTVEHDPGGSHVPIRKVANTSRVCEADSGNILTRRFDKPDWRNRLVTFEQYQHESDLGNPIAKGSRPRLVDTPECAGHFGLWLELARFRQRQYGLEGLRIIWKEVSRRGLKLPCHGPIAYELWSSMLQLGFEFPRILKEIEVYAKKLQESTGASWRELYSTILRHHLKTKPTHAYQWHAHLYQHFPPSLEQLKEMFRDATTNDTTLGFFRPIYIELGIRGMYDTIVPELCGLENHTAALKWHKLLLRKHDLPTNASVSEPLLHYIAMYGRKEHLVEITKGMINAGVSFPENNRSTYKSSPFISRELMNRQLGETHGVAPKVFSDEFCARLFATRSFAVDTIISGLRVLGVEAIGPLSLREIGSRENSKPAAICNRIDQLNSAGISIGSSTLSTLVRRLALEDKKDILNDVLTCDLHPDTFEDRNLQESLLVSYHRSGDKRQMERTLAILTVNSPYSNPAAERWNLLLRVYLTQRDLTGIQQTLEAMREMHIVVSPRSSSYLQVCMLSRRQVGKKPFRTDELPLVINVWREVLQLGGIVPPVAWREVLKRLGMSGQLKDFEALSLWLANWYSGAASRASGINLVSPTLRYKRLSKAHVPLSLSSRHPLHPLRILFPIVMQQAIIDWGFQSGSHGQTIKNLSANGPTDRPSWTWGLQLLQKLRQRRVMIEGPTIARICRQRLISLFGPGLSNRKRNRRMRQLNTSHLGQYLEQIHGIWGATILDRYPSLPISSRHRYSHLRPQTIARPATPHVTKYIDSPS